MDTLAIRIEYRWQIYNRQKERNSCGREFCDRQIADLVSQADYDYFVQEFPHYTAASAHWPVWQPNHAISQIYVLQYKKREMMDGWKDRQIRIDRDRQIDRESVCVRERERVCGKECAR